MPPAEVAVVRAYFEHEMDWNYVISKARQHCVLLLLNRNLQLHFAELVPKPVLLFLETTAEQCQLCNLALTRELLRILGIFEKHGIDAVPFKGPALAIAAYGNLSIRMFADLDILIREKDLVRAREALIADGYVAEFSLTPEQEYDYRKTECAVQLHHDGHGSVVELHWLLTERYLSINLPIAAFWQRRYEVKIGPRTVKVLAPEDLLLYLCVHGSKHRWERLEWLSCIAEIATANPSLDWLAIRERARVSGTQRILRTAVLLAQKLLATPLPDALRPDAENDPGAAHLAEQAAREMFTDQSRPKDQRVKGGDWYWYLLRTRERWADKCRILAYSAVRLPHPSSRELFRLPSQLTFLYYILRPARLLGATAFGAVRHAALVRNGARNMRTSAFGKDQVTMSKSHRFDH